MMRKIKNQQQTVVEYLDLNLREWILEFELSDFEASVANLLQIPRKIFASNAKSHFWAFLQVFLQNCEIGFILQQSNSKKNHENVIDLALIGYWEKEQYVIPLWILKDLLLGFEILPVKDILILDSKKINCTTSVLTDEELSLEDNQTLYLMVFCNDFFHKQKIYFKLEKNQISLLNYSREIEFFQRIAQAFIPELDGSEDS
ncbi:MAG: hypothetical protein ACXAC8_05835 [Candidatus Hodarchaeales archaeon]